MDQKQNKRRCRYLKLKGFIVKCFKIILASAALVFISSQLQGCAVAAIVAAVKYGDSAKIKAKQGCLRNYNNYLKLAKHPISLSQYCGDAGYSGSDDK